MTVYEKVVQVSKTYLGPATESFIARQCKSHLDKKAQDLMTLDLPTLAKWTEVGVALLADQAKATELANKIRAL